MASNTPVEDSTYCRVKGFLVATFRGDEAEGE
jgi:hypothetical protein